MNDDRFLKFSLKKQVLKKSHDNLHIFKYYICPTLSVEPDNLSNSLFIALPHI